MRCGSCRSRKVRDRSDQEGQGYVRSEGLDDATTGRFSSVRNPEFCRYSFQGTMFCSSYNFTHFQLIYIEKSYLKRYFLY